ncbi:MAG: enoyl-CoA hydratase [Actinobacteria bacterium 69-20]|nr:MAG: enoyl-CoA hydratase [Actinobacteria bacterium 69-20]
MDEAAVVQYELAGGVATITMDSPRNRNALSKPMRAQLSAALRRAGDDDDVRTVVLTHTGTVFCAGMDLKETAVAKPGEEGVRELPAILRLIAHCPKPVVARLAGPARAGGVGIMAACDIAVAVDSATFAFTEVRIGLIPAVISIPVLARLNPVAARELMLTGEVFDAARAREIGLVNAVVAPDELDAVVERFLDALLAGGPGALAGTKELLSGSLDDSVARYEALLEPSARQFDTPEAREGARAFAEKRPPAWRADITA